MVEAKRRYIARFRKGSDPMGMTGVDYFIDDSGQITRHEWAMGGQSFEPVNSVPGSIEGYQKINSEADGDDNPRS